MRSLLHEAAMRHDLGATLWRVGVTQDNRELRDLLPEQIEMLIERYPKDCQQYEELQKLLRIKRAENAKN